MTTPNEDHIALDLCEDIIRQTMAQLKSTALAAVGRLENATITSRHLNVIAGAFEDAQSTLIDEAIIGSRKRIISQDEYKAGRIAHSREIARERD